MKENEWKSIVANSRLAWRWMCVYMSCKQGILQ